ncbi:hypothetical protein [Actinomadura sp. NTSP31]|uniref:hypothetical protein n=1 Tax=Actinomadura sp. NTSP31 TaxID=1735447 RepID=UPI0035BF1C31
MVITVLVLVAMAALFGLCLPNLLRPVASADEPSAAGPAEPPPAAPEPAASEPAALVVPALAAGPGDVHPESMTAELDPGDEEYLAFLANELWPEDEYLEPEHTTDGEEESGGSDMLL